MKIEKKYLIAKSILIILAIVVFVLLYVIGTYIRNDRERVRQAKIIRGTYVSEDAFTNIALDNEKKFYYLSGKETSSGKYKVVNKQVFQALSGKLKNYLIIKDSAGDIILIDCINNNAAVFKKKENTVMRMEE